MKYKTIERDVYNARLNQWQKNTYLEPIFEEEDFIVKFDNEDLVKHYVDNPGVDMNTLLNSTIAKMGQKYEFLEGERESGKKNAEMLKTLLKLKKAANCSNWTGEPKPIYDDGTMTVFKIKKDGE